MNNEIKEILSYLKKKENTRRIKCITIEESKQLLDLISNLEQDNTMYAQLKDEYEEEIKELQQENERLKEQVNENKVIVEYAIKPSFTTRKLKDYKSRCEKAIEYIKYNDSDLYTFEPDYDYEENLIDNYEPSNFREDLLNILQNGSDSQ